MKKLTLSLFLITALLLGSVSSAFAAKPLDGNPKVTVKPLVILMDFKDYEYTDFVDKEKGAFFYLAKDGYNPDWYRMMYFGEDSYEIDGVKYDTVRKYYAEQSRGLYNLEGGVAGWYRAAEPIKYYGSSQGQQRGAELVIEAIKAAAQDPSVDLADYDVEDKENLDGDGNYFKPDGIIDTVILVHAGRGDEWGGGSVGSGNALWPFRGKLSWYETKYNKFEQFEVKDYKENTYKVEDFVIVAQDSLPMLVNHEFGHTLGLPDMYGSGDEPLRNWSIMGSSYLGEINATGSPQFGAYGRERLQEELGGDWARIKTFDLDDIDEAGLDVTMGTLLSDEETDLVRINLPDKIDFVKPYSGQYMYYSQKMDNADNWMAVDLDFTQQECAFEGCIRLQFKTLYDIEFEWDYASVQVKEAGSDQWVAIKGNITTDENPNQGVDGHQRNPGHGITGSTRNKNTGEYEWVDATFDLSSYAGKEIELRFHFFSDANTPMEGIYIDDIKVIAYDHPNQLIDAVEPSSDAVEIEGAKGAAGEIPESDLIDETDEADEADLGDDPNETSEADKTLPLAVIGTNPGDGDQDIAADAEITITFNEKIQEGPSFADIALTDEDGTAVEFVGIIRDDSNIQVIPNHPLKEGVLFTVSVPAGAVEDEEGNSLEEDYIFTFTTSEPAANELTSSGPQILFEDDAEDEVSKFTFGGFIRYDGVKASKHYYLLEWRNHEGTDRSLKSFVLRSWLPETTYDPGLVIWYVNESLGTRDRLDQDTYEHPGRLSVGVVDADQSGMLIQRPDEPDGITSWYGSLMTDSAFSLRQGSRLRIDYDYSDDYFLITNPHLDPKPVFNDSWDYTNKTLPETGLILENYGLQVYVTEESELRRSAKVHIANANKPAAHVQTNAPYLYFDSDNNEVVMEVPGQAGYKAYVEYTNGNQIYGQMLGYENDGRFRGEIDTSVIRPNEEWKVNYAVVDGAEYNAPMSGKKMYYSGSINRMDRSMTTSMDLSGTSHPKLTFKTWYDIEENHDYSYVKVRTQGMGKWIAIPGNITRGPGHGITGKSTDNQWTEAEFDLSDFAGKKIDLGFFSQTDGFNPRTGIYVGDIQVSSEENTIFSEKFGDPTKFRLDGTGYYEVVNPPFADSVKAFYNSELNPLIGTDLSTGNLRMQDMKIEFIRTPDSFKLDREAEVTVQIVNNRNAIADATLIVALYDPSERIMYNYYSSSSKGIEPNSIEELTAKFTIPKTGNYKVKAFVINNWQDFIFLRNSLEIPVRP